MDRRPRVPPPGTRLVSLVAVRRWFVAGLLVAVVGSSAVISSALSPRSAMTAALRPSVCLPGTTPGDLDRLFESQPGGIVGADYQRATSLSDGRVLWTFQDAEVRLPNGGKRLVHNVGMVQDGNCFAALIGGTDADPSPWLFAAETIPFRRWYWPLGAEVGADGRIHVFAAEMNERTQGYLGRTEPSATVVAIVDPVTLDVVTTTRPGDASAALYGFSIASDSTWTYLFSHCHRQFGFDPYIFVYAHDMACAPRVTVARVPRGNLLAAPTYWTANGWRSDPGAAVAILDTNRMVNAAQFTVVNGQWMAITKVGDWWGDRIVVEYSLRAVGPYQVVAQWAPPTKCAIDCNNYFASWIPSAVPGQLVYGLSHNRWDGIATAVYRPTFGSVTAPPPRLLPAERCSLGYCG